eukprot:TRINITY_DN117_c0_g1_i6.p2 TRINITY_DN117_c0_g1~~TRINITY_DN117_c0_g1_i6.p2  ORF type:complete len:265 (-),score=25.01 TRINITY_DN117_c0_g1_i6:1175-1969(-)
MNQGLHIEFSILLFAVENAISFNSLESCSWEYLCQAMKGGLFASGQTLLRSRLNVAYKDFDLRVPGYLKASNTVTHSKFDHDLVTLYLTESDSSGPPVQLRSKAYNDVNFPKFLLDWHAKQPLPQTYPDFIKKLEHLAIKYLSHYKVPSKKAPLFLFALLHALRARDMQRWNNIAMTNGCPDLTVNTVKDLLASHNKLTQRSCLRGQVSWLNQPWSIPVSMLFVLYLRTTMANVILFSSLTNLSRCQTSSNLLCFWKSWALSQL